MASMASEATTHKENSKQRLLPLIPSVRQGKGGLRAGNFFVSEFSQSASQNLAKRNGPVSDSSVPFGKVL